MKALIACEYSGIVRDAFRARGVDAISCDLLPTERPGPHYQGDVRDILYRDWDLLIAFPPCTYLAYSGARWLYNEDGTRNEARWVKLEEAAMFFKLFVDHPCEKICIENPVMLSYAKKIIRKDHSQIIQPWMFGHGEVKKTCLWLKGLPQLRPTNIVEGREQRIWKIGPEGWPVCTAWVKWDWGNDGDGWNEPPDPEPDDPWQLLLPFSVLELFGMDDGTIIEHKKGLFEKELIAL